MFKASQQISSVSTALLRVIWPSVAAFLSIVAFALISLDVLMGLRGLADGENSWSKNQQALTAQLLLYMHGDGEKALQRFDQAMEIHLIFRQARELMLQKPLQHDKIVHTLRRAGIDEEGAHKMLWLYRYIGHTAFFRQLLDLWEAGDEDIGRLPALRDELLEAYARDAIQPARIGQIASTLRDIDERLNKNEHRFAELIRTTSYSVYLALFGGLLILGSLLLLVVLWRTRRFLIEREYTERAIHAERHQAGVILASIGEAVLGINLEERITYMNRAARLLCHYEGALTAGQEPKVKEVMRLGEDSKGKQCDIETLFTNLIEGHRPSMESEGDCQLVRSDNIRVPVSWFATPVMDAGRIHGIVLVLHETSRERQLIDRLSWLATHDPLTNLPNRREFESRLQNLLDESRQRFEQGLDEHIGHALLFIDLDQFKVVNDTCGHAAGDQLLRQVSDCISAQLRAEDTLARMGGDEFAVLLLDCSLENALSRADEIRALVADVELFWEGRVFHVSASIGLVHLRQESWDLGGALSAADLACYKAKDNGRNRIEVYCPDDSDMVERVGEMSWVQKIRRALREDDLCLYAQPITDLDGECQVERYELLLRMWDEDRWVLPGAFLPAAERYGLMTQIDRWVVSHALEYIARFYAVDEQHSLPVFSVNLSGGVFADAQFIDDLKAEFVRHGVPYSCLCFEITETQAVSNLDLAVAFIAEMRALGCAFALDDFGAGMSSFAYLKDIPVDYLKIDGKLVKEIVSGKSGKAMVEMINRLGQTMGIRTIGEYAETPEIVDALREIGVDFAQGYATGRPQPWQGQQEDDKNGAAVHPAAPPEPPEPPEPQ